MADHASPRRGLERSFRLWYKVTHGSVPVVPTDPADALDRVMPRERRAN